MKFFLSKSFPLLCIAFALHSTSIYAQEKVNWHNPTLENQNYVQGSAWPNELKGTYNRLPAKIEADVRKPVWNLSLHSAGNYIEFKSDAPNITIRYAVKERLALPHMPATGVSGLDLYLKDGKNNWKWAPAKFTFKDTITYSYPNLNVFEETTFRLYLPLYNQVTWLEIGTGNENTFSFALPQEKTKPILIYGTSIAQGACASRPGLAWTSILGRLQNEDVINLGFSGNGILDKPIIDLISNIDAKVFILDNMPNLDNPSSFSEEEVKKRVNYAVNQLRSKHKNTPIILVQHSGGNATNVIETARNTNFNRINKIIAQTYTELKNTGVKHLYFLTTNDINMGIESTVDGLHPNDIGMVEHAKAYHKLLNKIAK